MSICPACGKPAYVGLTFIDCDNCQCPYFVEKVDVTEKCPAPAPAPVEAHHPVPMKPMECMTAADKGVREVSGSWVSIYTWPITNHTFQNSTTYEMGRLPSGVAWRQIQ